MALVETNLPGLINCFTQVLENKPTATFWTSLGSSLEKYVKDASKGNTAASFFNCPSNYFIGSAFVQTTLGAGYPRLLRLFHDFFAKVAVHTDIVYTQAFQRSFFCQI